MSALPALLILLLLAVHESYYLAFSFIPTSCARLRGASISFDKDSRRYLDSSDGHDKIKILEGDSSEKSSMFFATVEDVNKEKTLKSSTQTASPLGAKGRTDVSTIERNATKNSNLSLPYTRELSELILSPEIELLDTGLVLLSSFLVAVSTLQSSTLPQSIYDGSVFIENNILSYFFGIAFFVRWYGIGNLSAGYLLKPLPFIDFFASVLPLALMNAVTFWGIANVPPWLLSNSALVNLRLLRILRLQELLVDLETFEKLGGALGLDVRDVRPYQLQLARVLISIFTLCSVATGLIYTAEHEVNPLIPDYFTALYFGLTTLTTVGFGDITPITVQGKLVVMGSILVGVAVIPAQAAELVEALLELQEERRKEKMIKNTLRTRIDGFENDTMIDPRISCPSCGRRSHRGDALFCWNCGSKLWV